MHEEPIIVRPKLQFRAAEIDDTEEELLARLRRTNASLDTLVQILNSIEESEIGA